MSNLSDHDLKQMSEDWQGRQPEPVVRSLLKRTLDELRVARDRLNQNPNNSSRPSGSMAPWRRSDDLSKAVTPLAEDPQEQDCDEVTEDAQNTSTAATRKTNGTQDSSAEPTDTDAPTKAVVTPEAEAPSPPPPKRAGRAKGAPGYGRMQKLAPTKFQEKHPTDCAACQRVFTLTDPAQAWTAWDTLELCELGQDPANPHQLGLYIEVTRHVLTRKCCPCGHTTRAEAWRAEKDSAWEGVNIGEQRLLGPRLAATVVYLSLRMRLPRRKVQELLLELFGLELSTALIDQAIKQTARSVAPLEGALAAQLEEAVLAHADETSWRESAQALWLWVVCCSHTVLYVIGARSKEMFNNVLSPGFMGTLMSDGYGAYRSRLNRLRCWAHLLRKLRGVAESTDHNAAQSGKAMLDLFSSLMAAVFEARDQLKGMPPGTQDDPPALPVASHALQIKQLYELCEKYRDAKHDALRAIAREFLNDWAVIMRVLTDPLLPLTNNAAERQLRHWVIARRISYGTRTLVGSNSLALLASVIDTCRLRNASITDLLTKAIHAARHGLPAPELPPIPAHLLGRHGALVGM